MNQFLILIAVLFAFFLSVHQTAYAHFPATDGDMTVTLHVDPNDDPTPEQQANLYFLFDYIGGNFQAANCSCVVTVSEQKKQIFQQQLTPNNDKQPSIWGARVPFIFPQNDVYHIVLTGKPKKDNAFQSFYLSWYFRVDPDTPGLVVQRPSDLPYLLGGAGVGIIFLILFGWFIKIQILDAEEKEAEEIKRQHKKRVIQ